MASARPAPGSDHRGSRATQVARRVRVCGMAAPAAAISRPPRCRFPPEHASADLLRRRVGRELARDPPLVQRHDAVGQRVDLIELRRDQQDRAAGRLLLQDLPSRRTRSPRRPSRGWAAPRATGRDRSPAHAPGSASAGSRPDSVRAVTSMLRARTSNSASNRVASSLILRMREDADRPENSASSCRPMTRVLPQGHVEDQALLVPVLGDERDARVADLLGGQPATSLPSQQRSGPDRPGAAP